MPRRTDWNLFAERNQYNVRKTHTQMYIIYVTLYAEREESSSWCSQAENRMRAWFVQWRLQQFKYIKIKHLKKNFV